MESSTAAIVVTHNNEDTISACISSLHENGVRGIVVIDNASSDGTAERLKNLPVKLLVNEQNKGFGAAVNHGFYNLLRPAEASSEGGQPAPYNLFLLLNPDAVLQPNSLSQAVQYMENNAKVGIIGLSLRDQAGNPEPHSFGNRVTLWSLFTRRFRRYELQITNYKLPALAGWVSGGAMLVRREVFEELKGFDEHFFLYWEDIDFCERARQVGWNVVVAPSAPVTHQRGASLADAGRKAALYDQSADRYFYKHYATPIWLTHRYLRRIYRFFFPRAL